jgi:ubiquinone/menaquinone biosynthesis C-methylase UbiE
MSDYTTGFYSDVGGTRYSEIGPYQRSGSAVDMYSTDEYILKNPTLDVADSPWKVGKITPFMDMLFARGYIRNDKMTLLDVGGGAGIILKEVSKYLTEVRGADVIKLALDLSPGMLAVQKKNNPDLYMALNEDICRTSLGDKAVDVTLMIDVLEHILEPENALKELSRISRFAVFKVPLEDNLCVNLANLLTVGKVRRDLIKRIGHINVYNMRKLESMLENCGTVLHFCYTNVFSYYLTSEHYLRSRSLLRKFADSVASRVFAISPEMCSSIFNDFALVLVQFD